MRGFRRIAAAIGVLASALLSLWAGARGMLDLIGRPLAAEDFVKPDGLVARGALWFFSTPWWMPAVLAALVVFGVLLLIYLTIRDRAQDTPASVPAQATEPSLRPIDWDKPLTPVIRQNYKNETVPLDGRHFIECTFENVTFLYQGMRPTQMSNCRKIPDAGFIASVHSDNPSVITALPRPLL